MERRQRQFNLVVGAPGHGKSTFIAKRMIAASPDKNAIIYKEELNIDDAAFSMFARAKFKEYKGGKVKMSSFDVDYKTFMKEVYAHFRNGHIVIDDGTLYERDMVTKELSDLATMRRHLGVDITVAYHGMTYLPIQQFPLVNNIILFHTTDSLYKGRRLPGVELIQAAKDRIAAQVAKGNKYYHEVIKLS